MSKAGAGDSGSSDRQVLESTLAALMDLEGIPFHYIVPDVNMLPAESIAFFQVDQNWILSLADGALSPGGKVGVGTQELMSSARGKTGELRRKLLKQTTDAGAPPAPPTTLSGFILRSQAVVGWPGMETEAYTSTDGTGLMNLVHFDRPSPTVLFAIFSGPAVLARVDIHEPGEGIHFGTSTPTTPLIKGLRWASDGTSNGQSVSTGDPIMDGQNELTVTLQLRSFNGTPNGVVQVSPLVTAMTSQVFPTGSKISTITAAEYALEMVQGVERVTFDVNS